MTIKGPPFSRTQSTERHRFASKVHKHLHESFSLRKINSDIKSEDFLLRLSRLAVLSEGTQFFKAVSNTKWRLLFLLLEQQPLPHTTYTPIPACSVHPEISGTPLCQQLLDVGRNSGSWYQKELNLRLQQGQLEKCKRQQTELHALNQLFQT